MNAVRRLLAPLTGLADTHRAVPPEPTEPGADAWHWTPASPDPDALIRDLAGGGDRG